jgi:2-enoate reductase
MMKEEHKILFQPIKIGKVEVKNRYVMAPMGPGGLCDEQGCYNEKGIEYYVERAKGGTGLIITGVTYVENDIEKCVMPSMPCPTINPLNFIKTAKPMTERVHAYGAKIFSQLSGGFGRVSIPSIVGRVAVAPSPIPHRFLDNVTCRELTIDEIHTYIEKFADAAVVCKKAGFDGIEIHAVHEGYLIDQFAISFYNHRTDEYGGSLENRLRFAIEILKAVKQACGQDYPVSLRYSLKSFVKDWREGALPGEEFVEAGRDIEEGKLAARMLVEAGYDALNADVGTYDSWYWNHPPMYHKKGMYLTYNEILKQTVNVPIMTAGRMDNPDLAANAILTGKTDIIALGRPLLADSEIPNKIIRGEYAEVRPCLSCQEGCMGRLAVYAQISCAVNPACGREREYGLTPAPKKKKILIVGGGVAGLEAARVCAIRGHGVTLFEKAEKLGGNLIPGGMPDFKEDDHALVRWYELQLKKLGVDVQTGTEVTKELLQKSDADEIILATGSKPKMLQVPGVEMLTAEDVLNGRRDAGMSTVIIGGGLVGCETALYLKQSKGTDVTIVELQSSILSVGGPLCAANTEMLLDLMKFHKIRILSNSCVTGKSEDGYTIKTANGEVTVATESVICAIGYNSEKSLYQEVRDQIPYVHLLGDAENVSNIMYAIWNAYELARNI